MNARIGRTRRTATGVPCAWGACPCACWRLQYWNDLPLALAWVRRVWFSGSARIFGVRRVPLVGLILTQILPFADQKTLQVLGDFEGAIYKARPA